MHVPSYHLVTFSVIRTEIFNRNIIIIIIIIIHFCDLEGGLVIGGTKAPMKC